MNVQRAYRACEEITRREARNFSYGIRLLRPPERRALSTVYALARRIDDIGDGTDPADQKLAGLARVRKALHPVPTDTDDPVLVALGDVDRRYGLPMDAFDDLLDGCEMDVVGTAYGSIDDLVAYCRRVAGSIGRLSLAVFGTDEPTLTVPLADDLGVALQLTNILRDVVEDRGNGRVYLPADDAASVGCDPDLSGPRSSLVQLVALECSRARGWFERGLPLLDHLDHRSRACVGAMAGIYFRLLERIERQPETVLDRRISLPGWEKAWVAVQSLTAGRR